MKDLQRSYLLELDYGNRKREHLFVKDILSRYDRDTLVGSLLFVNNNPYHLELLWFLNFENNHEDFDDYVAIKYPDKKRAYNRFVEDLIDSMDKRSYNIVSVNNVDDVDTHMSPEANGVFLLPDRDVLFEEWGKPVTINNYTVFLSHSSKDKAFVDRVFNELQKSGISAWYDKVEISAGDSITHKINDGLQKSNFGLIFLSDNFINGLSGWTTAEANFFIQQRMREPSKKFVIINIDLAHEQMPPLMQDYRYIDAVNDDCIAEIKRAIANHQTSI